MISFLAYFKPFKNKNRPILMIELLFDIVIVALLGGVSHNIINYIPQIVQTENQYNLVFNIFQLITMLLIWRAMMLYSLRHSDSLHLRMVKFVIMIPLLFQVVSTYTKAANASDFEIIFRISPYAYFGTCMVVAFTFILSTRGEDVDQRAHNVIVGTPFLISGISAVLGAELGYYYLGLTFTYLQTTFWIWLVSLIAIVTCQVLAGQRRFHEFKRPVLENLKERYNVLFIVFLGEYFITQIAELANSSHPVSHIIDNLPLFGLAIFLGFGLWWVFTDIMNYYDIRRTDNAILIFSFSILVSLIGVLLMADGMSLAMHVNTPYVNYNEFGVYTFISGLLTLVVSFSVNWFAIKLYNHHRRLVFTRWMQIANLIILPILLVGAVASALVTGEVIIAVGLVGAMCFAFLTIEVIAWAPRWFNPVPTAQFEAEIAHLKYKDHWQE